MDNNQKTIFEWLKEQDECLGELYEAAVRMVEDDSFPGRKRLICHAVREIRNRLPEVVGAKGIKQRVDNTQELKELTKLWESEGVLGVYQKDNEDSEPIAERLVSEKFLKQVERVVQGHTEVKDRKEHNAKQLFMALEAENNKWVETLGPVVKQWLDVTEWFVSRVHVGRAINNKILMVHFEKFERVLSSLIGYFYEGMDKIKGIVDSVNSSDAVPNEEDVAQVVALLGRSNYRIYFFKELKNPHWLEPLKRQGFFRIPDDPQKGEAYDRWLEGWYLDTISEKIPEKVLDVIQNIECENPHVRSGCIKCLLKMPLEIAAKGNKVIGNVLKQEFMKGGADWWWIGQNCAKLMIKMVDEFPDSAFKIAWPLLEASVSEEKTFGKDIVAKFSEEDYRELMREYFSKVWEAEPERAVRVLIKILNRCLKALDEKEDASRTFGYGLALGDLDTIDLLHPEIKTVLVKGICEAGRFLINNEPGKVSELLDELEGTNRVIFLRIAMYLLRFVKPDAEKPRINKFVGNPENFKEYNPCWKEHRRLMNDQFDEVDDTVKREFIDWVKTPKITEERKKDVAELCQKNKEPLPDFEKWENHAKAEELYFVREKFKDEYERYKNAAGVENDSELAPRKMVSAGRDVSPTEGTPLTSEEMAAKKVSEVLDYVSNPKNHEVKKRKQIVFRDAASALRATFKKDVKKRYKDYLESDVENFKKLSASFLASFFYGVGEVVREGSFDKKDWELLIGFAFLVVEEKHEDQEYRDCFSEILSVLREGFGGGKGELELDESTAKKFWGILKKLIHFPVKHIENRNEERDPVQLMLRHVSGKALELTVLLGLTCKKGYSEYWEKELKAEMRESWKYVLKNIIEPGINCVFGIEFSRIHWLDTEWVEGNLDLIFKDELWEEVWGTYTSWGRPSLNGFKLLVQEQQYLEAVKRIGQPSKFKFGKEPDKGLTEHLMIGYFNGWIDYEHEVLQQFFEKAPASLRAKAARFLTTGFKGIKEGDDEKYRQEVAVRMREYWKKRLEAMDKEEAVGFMKWVSDSVLDGKETLEFVEETLKISDGKLSKHGDIKGFVDGVCELGQIKGNELLALQCLKLAASDKNMHTTWASIQDPLVNFLGAMVDMPEDVRGAAIEVVDAYGRYNPDKFRGVWAELNEKQ